MAGSLTYKTKNQSFDKSRSGKGFSVNLLAKSLPVQLKLRRQKKLSALSRHEHDESISDFYGDLDDVFDETEVAKTREPTRESRSVSLLEPRENKRLSNLPDFLEFSNENKDSKNTSFTKDKNESLMKHDDSNSKGDITVTNNLYTTTNAHKPLLQPLDKYDHDRVSLRERDSLNHRPHCDYETHILLWDGSVKAQSKNAKKKRKNELSGSEDVTSVAHQKPAFENNKHLPFLNNSFLRRSVSGKSKVPSIGVKWTVPPASEHVNTAANKSSKYGWLEAQYMKNYTTGTNYQTLQDPKSRLSHDIHPVSTAMGRQGISVSQVKWRVPSCKARAVDVTRSVMQRLELIKRPGSHLLFDHDHVQMIH